jgi:hypothetical protein
VGLTWQAGFTPTRLVAAWTDHVYPESGDFAENAGKRVVLLARGTLGGVDTLCAQVYTCDASGFPVFTSQSTFDCAAGGRDVAEGSQAFAIIGENFYVRGWDTAGSANSSYVARIIGACGGLVVVDSTLDDYIRIRRLAADAATGEITSTTVGLAAPTLPLPGFASVYNMSAPRAALAASTGPGALILATRFGLTRIVDDGTTVTSKQVATPHALTFDHPFGMSSFSALHYSTAYDTLTFVGIRGAGIALAGLRVTLSSYTALFAREAYKL